jgi:hypothetical protein
LTDTNGVPAKRLFALGQFSRFVRPDYYRIGAHNSGNVAVGTFKLPKVLTSDFKRY